MKHTITCMLLCSLALPALAQQSPKDVEMLNKYAGTWAVDCGVPGTRLTVGVEALTLSAGSEQLRATAPLTAFSYFGRQLPPQGFDVALLGNTRPGGYALLAMKDDAGPYLTVDADTSLESQLGKAALAGKFRRCP